MNKSFHEKYEMRVIDDNKRYVRRHLSGIMFSDMYDKDRVMDSCVEQTEKLLTITIPESRLEELEKIHNIFYNNIEVAGDQRRMFELIMEQRYAERDIRKRFPGVQEAYEHYSTLLYLSGYSDKVNLD
jgi:hypothetical protein